MTERSERVKELLFLFVGGGGWGGKYGEGIFESATTGKGGRVTKKEAR